MLKKCVVNLRTVFALSNRSSVEPYRKRWQVRHYLATSVTTVTAVAAALWWHETDEDLTSPASPYYATASGEPLQPIQQLHPRAAQNSDGGNTLECDVLVIGGGFAGLYTALRLASSGNTETKRIVVLEARRVGAGASGVCGGMGIPGFHSEVDDIAAWYSQEVANVLYAQTEVAAKWIEDLVKTKNISCDFDHSGYITAFRRGGGGGGPATTKPAGDDSHTRHEAAAAAAVASSSSSFLISCDNLETKSRFVNSTILNGGSEGMSNAFSINPLALCRGLKRVLVDEYKVQVVEYCEANTLTRVEEGSRSSGDGGGGAWEVCAVQREPPAGSEEGVARGEHSAAAAAAATTTSVVRIRAKHVVCCTNTVPSWFSWPLSLRHIPIYSAILVTNVLDKSTLDTVLPSRVNICDDRRVLAYFRRLKDDRILWGGRMPSAIRLPDWMIRRMLLNDLYRTFPELAPAAGVGGGGADGAPSVVDPSQCSVWTGRMITGYRPLPLVGRVDRLLDSSSNVSSPSSSQAPLLSTLWVNAGHFCHGVVPTAAAAIAVAGAIQASAESSSVNTDGRDDALRVWEHVAPTVPVMNPWKQLVAEVCSVYWLFADGWDSLCSTA